MASHEHTEIVETTTPRRTEVVNTPGHTEVVHHTTPAATDAEHVEAYAYDPYAERRHSSYKLVQAIYLIFGFIEALIAIRFVLRALGANPSAGFAQFIYGVTAPLIAPFVGLFGTPQLNASALELHSLIALVIYALLAWLIAKIAWLLVGETRSSLTTSARSVETRVR